MTLLKRFTVVAAKIETVPYVAETLAAADSNYNVFDSTAAPAFGQKERLSGDGPGNRPSTVGLRSGTASFKVDLHGDGSGGVPAWAATFLPACALIDTSGAFKPLLATPPENEAADNGIKTLTIGIYENGRLKLLTGCMGTAKFMFPTGQDAYIEFNFTGSWAGVTDAAAPTPTYPTQLPLRFAAASLLINDGTNDFEPCVNEAMVDLGNAVVLRPCQKNSNASGYRGALVTDRKVNGSLDPEAQLVADYDTFGDWENSIQKSLTIELSDSVDKFTIEIPKFQLTNVGEGDRVGIRTDPLTFQANRDAAANDEITITFAAA